MAATPPQSDPTCVGRDESSRGLSVGRNRGRVDGRSPVRVPRSALRRRWSPAVVPFADNQMIRTDLPQPAASSRSVPSLVDAAEQPRLDDAEPAHRPCRAAGSRSRAAATRPRPRWPRRRGRVPGSREGGQPAGQVDRGAEQVAHPVQHPPAGEPDPDRREPAPRGRPPAPGRPRRPTSGSVAAKSTSSPRVLTSRPAERDDELGRPALEPLDQRAQLVLVQAAGQAGEVDQVGEPDRQRDGGEPVLVGVEHPSDGGQQVPPPGVDQQVLEVGQARLEPGPGATRRSSGRPSDCSRSTAMSTCQSASRAIVWPIARVSASTYRSSMPAVLDQVDRALQRDDVGVGVRAPRRARRRRSRGPASTCGPARSRRRRPPRSRPGRSAARRRGRSPRWPGAAPRRPRRQRARQSSATPESGDGPP